MNYFAIEVVIILGVIIFQVVHFISVYTNITALKSVFNHLIFVKNGFIERKYLVSPDRVEDNIVYGETNEIEFYDKDIVKITTTDTKGDNEIIKRINNAINNYLVNNYGAAVNFSIIKDIIDREVDAKDEEISQSIPTPLYLGLAATMVGIILGLFAMPEVRISGIEDINDDSFYKGINALISGVKLAMFASLTGLFCTTLLSSVFYKKAKKKILKDKNDQLSYLQAKLLPELIKAEETGVSGLKASLDRFAREATKISENVNNAAVHTGINIKAQQDTIARIEKIDIVRISKINLELFDHLEHNMAAFSKFAEFLNSMAVISENLRNFAERTIHIDGIAGQIKGTLSESNELTRFLMKHFEKMELAGASALMAVDLSDAHFREAIESLKSRTTESIASFSAFADQKESDLKETLLKINENLTETAAKHVDQFTAAYSNAVPQFKQLDKLESLLHIQETVASRTSELIENSGKSNHEILSKLSEFENRVNGNTLGLEHAIKELTRHLAGNNPSAPMKKKLWLNKAEVVMRLIAWVCIVTLCLRLLFAYFNIL